MITVLNHLLNKYSSFHLETKCMLHLSPVAWWKWYLSLVTAAWCTVTGHAPAPDVLLASHTVTKTEITSAAFQKRFDQAAMRTPKDAVIRVCNYFERQVESHWCLASYNDVTYGKQQTPFSLITDQKSSFKGNKNSHKSDTWISAKTLENGVNHLCLVQLFCFSCSLTHPQCYGNVATTAVWPLKLTSVNCCYEDVEDDGM